jgi:hypothetical protein
MVAIGAKPKAARLRLVDGTHRNTRHGDIDRVRERAEASKFPKPVKPKHLTGEAAFAWKRYIAPANWLDASKEPIAIAFCELWKEFRFAPTQFSGSKHGQMRAYLNELGLSDERNRCLAGSEDKDEFFDD